MELKNLRTLQAVADQGSYQKAADCLGYTQSTVTVHIQQLEEELGIPLFERVGRGMALTQMGRQALIQARELLLAADRLSFVLASACAGWGGVSILCQTAAVLEGSGLRLRNCVRGKVIQGVLAGALAAAGSLWLF